MNITGPVAYREASKSGAIYDDDVIMTGQRQSVAIQLDDDTIIALGPHSKLKILNWSKRTSAGVLSRRFFAERGVYKFEVRKQYSQVEPFVVETDNGVVSIHNRATFSLESKGDKGSDVYVSAGAIEYASSKKFLTDPSLRVVLAKGTYSYVRAGEVRPQGPARFTSSTLANRLASLGLPADVRAPNSLERKPASLGNSKYRRRAKEAFLE